MGVWVGSYVSARARPAGGQASGRARRWGLCGAARGLERLGEVAAGDAANDDEREADEREDHDDHLHARVPLR